ncbi:sensor histidine kinase [Paenibacillus alkalitolerans]|uniref:sensor histidine kinase n=1 Tax=Paenibacillus alkalitolerans TaxID=2799335 RepID=UPI0018F3C8A9|nr:histidine kinase [Paenibacillus alkalitolerans]
MRVKIRTKIIAICAFVITASLFSSGFFTYEYVTGILRERSVNDSKTHLAQISVQLSRVREQVVKIAEYIVSDEEIHVRIAPNRSATLEEEYFRMHEVQDRLKRFTALNAFILNALIVREDGATFSNNSGYADYFAEYLKQPWFQSFLDSGRRIGFTAPHDFFYLNGKRPVFSYVVKYKNLQAANSPDYYLVLDIQLSEITNAFEQSAADFEQMLLFNGTGDVLFLGGSAPDESFGQMIERAMQQDGIAETGEHIAISYAPDPDGWKQAAVISKKKLFAPINRILDYYLLITVSSLAAMLLIILPFIVNMTRPISKLTQAMKRVSVGDLNTSVSIRSGDEMELLGAGFNRMVGDLSQYVQASIRHEETKRKMQISLLMAQINPHFIYNTLNTVIYLSHAGRSNDAAKITEALIGILQDTIKTGDEEYFSTLQEEIHVVAKYIDIQHYRYPGRFRVEWSVDESLLAANVPRLVIQPLVENALFHGVIPMDEAGVIRISVRRVDDGMLIEVEDNGIGLQEASGRRRDRMRGIGLSNVRERIRYLYGGSFGVTVVNGEERGAKAAVRLPLRDRI